MIIIITHAPDPHTENKRNQTHPIHQLDCNLMRDPEPHGSETHG